MTPSSPEADVVRYLLRLVDHDPDGEPRAPRRHERRAARRAHHARALRPRPPARRQPRRRSPPGSRRSTRPGASARCGPSAGPSRRSSSTRRTAPTRWSRRGLHADRRRRAHDRPRRHSTRRAGCWPQGRALIDADGLDVFEMLSRLIEAKLELRLAHDPVAALAILDALDREGDARRYDFIDEQVETWRGLALLLGEPRRGRRRAARARRREHRSVRRILELPTAAVCWPRRSGGAATRTPPTARPTSRSTPRPSRAPTTTCS